MVKKMPNENGTMTEFKYGNSNYHKKLSIADKTNTASNPKYTTGPLVDEKSRRPRLKKSFSECEYYENAVDAAYPFGGVSVSGMEINFNLPPTKRKLLREKQVVKGPIMSMSGGDLQYQHHSQQKQHHPSKQQTSINNIAFIDENSGGKLQYSYDTLKSQYLLQQQMKLKEYKNDPNYHSNNGDNFMSESSTETKSILKKGPTNESCNDNKNSLKRNKGLSTLSLCSCDAAATDTEVIPSQSRPLYQYSLDRKRPLHTYSCEQNAQILLRLERERLKKCGSHSRLHFTGLSATETPSGLKQSTVITPTTALSLSSSTSKQNNSGVDFRMPPGYPETNHIEEAVFIGNANRSRISNNKNSDEDDDNLIPPNFPPPPAKSFLKRNSSVNRHQQQQQQNSPASNALNLAINQNKSIALSSSKPDLFNFANSSNMIVPSSDENLKHHNPSMSTTKSLSHAEINGTHANGNYCQAKNIQQAYPVIFCENEGPQHQLYNDSGAVDKCHKENSFYLYHHDPTAYLPNYDNISSSQKNILPPIMIEKYNTMDCNAGMYPLQQFNIPVSKLHASTCNLNNQFHSSNLNNGHNFSNSLSNFNMMDPNQQIQNYYNFNPSFTQLPPDAICERTIPIHGGSIGAFGSSSIIGSTFASNISLNGTPKQPWKHRQGSSRSSSSGTNSSKWDLPPRQWLALTSILLIAGAASVAVPLALSITSGSPFEERFQAALQFLDAVPFIDGHNDLPWNVRKFMHNQINDFRFDDDLKMIPPWANSSWSHTDLQRLKRGRVSAQFWAAYVPCEAQYKDAVQITLEQIDLIERLTDRYSPQLTKCISVYDIREAHKNRQICSLIGVEGGHSLAGSLGVLRTFYTLGVRYMTLTSTCHTPWADSSNADAPKYDVKHGGLTAYGKIIVREMNRLGMIVDLSKSSVSTMRDVFSVTEAPVIFSHSSAYSLCNSSRNVQDEILQMVTRNRGLVMVNFYNKFLSCNENATVHDAVAHINHIKNVAGIDHIGIGAGYDGINYTPKGLEDTSAYPYLFAELMGHGWTVEELTKLAGANLLRVMSEVEQVRDTKRLNNVKPFEDIPNFRLPLQTSDEQLYNCSNNNL